jgi:hypothetical protein
MPLRPEKQFFLRRRKARPRPFRSGRNRRLREAVEIAVKAPRQTALPAPRRKSGRIAEAFLITACDIKKTSRVEALRWSLAENIFLNYE